MPKESINESIFSAISHRGFGTALSELIPTAENNAKHKQRKEHRAAVKIQRSFKNHHSKGEFEEKRGAAIFVQAAARRLQAKKMLQVKKNDLQTWAAMEIQDKARRMILKKAAKREADRRRAGVLGMGLSSFRKSFRSTSAEYGSKKQKKPSLGGIAEYEA
jgi:hypothetical protein|eukprot:jgi/Chrpa1/4709/Chrysochromulina_OHIO_Genome00013934-RA